MAVLLNTEIESQVNAKIRNKVARIGGTMNQLLRYRGCEVEDLNLQDGGYGDVLKSKDAKAVSSRLNALTRAAIQEVKYLIKGPRISRDRKTIIQDINHAHENPGLRNRFDCSVSSNVIEHSPNPILLLLNFYFITRKDGYQYHALPHYKYTFDMYREPTPIEHMVEDFEKMTGKDDATHTEDYIQSAIVKHGWQKDFHTRYPVSYPYMHFHVFDETNTRQLMEYMFEDVINDVLKTDQFSDNVVLFRNRLNVDFMTRHEELINRYSKVFLLN